VFALNLYAVLLGVYGCYLVGTIDRRPKEIGSDQSRRSIPLFEFFRAVTLTEVQGVERFVHQTQGLGPIYRPQLIAFSASLLSLLPGSNQRFIPSQNPSSQPSPLSTIPHHPLHYLFRRHISSLRSTKLSSSLLPLKALLPPHPSHRLHQSSLIPLHLHPPS
jgi:hypothetical protein